LALQNLRIGGWVIQDEGGPLVIRDTTSGGDSRYAMFRGAYRDL
jgi:hypothetical protein